MGLLDNNTGTQSGGLSEGESSESQAPDYTEAPAYLVGSDVHNYGNGNFAITDPSTWGQAPADITKFIVGSVGSGLTSIYNSGVQVANWLGSDAKQADTQDVLSSIDDDLGQYYSQHKQAEDLVGFLATSLLPGTAGVKVLNAGQKILGAVEDVGMGANLARATGLLPDAAAKFAQSAASDIASSGAQISLMNQNVLKGLAAGIGQNMLEGAAFTTAVQATMFKSPILQDQDGWDIAQNILTGGVVQGAIGGVFSAAKMLGVIKRGVSAADEVLQPSIYINELPSTATPADRIVQRLQDLADTKTFTDVDDFTENWLNQFPNAKELDNQALFNRYQTNVANRSVRLNNYIQQDLSELTGGDQDLTQQLAHTLSSIDPLQAQGNVEQLLSIGRITTPLKEEQQILAQAAGKGFLEPLEANAPIASRTKEIQYVKLFGEDAGTQTNLRPAAEQQSLADKLGSAADVNARVASYGFQGTADFVKLAAKDLDQADARYIWAKGQKLVAGQTLNGNDIPLLEQAYLQKVPVNVKEADGSVSSIQTQQDMLQKLKDVKMQQATDLLAQGKNTDYIAKATNVSRDSLEHTQSADPVEDLLARQTVAQKYTQQLIQKNLWSSAKGTYDLDTKPSWAKVAYSTKAYKDADGNVVKGMARIAAVQKVAQQAYENVFSKAVGD